MFDWLKRFRHRQQRQRSNKEKNDLTRSVIVCGPEYDEATGVIGQWLKEIPVPDEILTYYAIGPSVTRETFAELLTKTADTIKVKIFGGHGSAESLLGPSYHGCIAIQLDGNRFAVLYDRDSIGEGTSSLFAFCCKSAQQLGPLFAYSDRRSFLGYTGNIGYDLDNEECREVWKKIIHLASQQIIADGEITETHEKLLRTLYDDGLDYFRNGPGKNNDRHLETMLLLTRHKKLLRRIGGSK